MGPMAPSAALARADIRAQAAAGKHAAAASRAWEVVIGVSTPGESHDTYG